MLFIQWLEKKKIDIVVSLRSLTEFIPISSTAHLKVIPLFFGIDDPGLSLSAIFQLGSVFALVWYFKSDIFKLRIQLTNKNFYYLKNKKLLWSILIATIPIIFFGVTKKLFLTDFPLNFLIIFFF